MRGMPSRSQLTQWVGSTLAKAWSVIGGVTPTKNTPKTGALMVLDPNPTLPLRRSCLRSPSCMASRLSSDLHRLVEPYAPPCHETRERRR